MAKKKVTAPTKKTYVAIVLDSSGSMSNVTEQTIAGYNEQIKTLKESGDKAGEILVTFVVFGAEKKKEDVVSPPVAQPLGTVMRGYGAFSRDVSVETIYKNRPISEVESLTPQTYRPYGSTPMYDGVGRAILALEAEDREGDKDTSFLVITVSDGCENASTEFNARSIADKVTTLQAKGNWTFVYIGANQDLSEVAKNTGISASNLRSYESNELGTTKMYGAASTATSSFLCAREKGVRAVSDYWSSSDEKEVVSSEKK